MKKTKVKVLISFAIVIVMMLDLIPVSASVSEASSFDICEVKQYLREELINFTEYIDISSFEIENNSENVTMLETLIFDGLPDCFHFESFVRYTAYGDIVGIAPDYTVSESEYLQMYEAVEKVKENIIEDIKDNDALGDVEKALLIHDRLALLCEYDFNKNDNRYNIYGALVNGKAVCQGYALAYEYLLEAVGIDAYICRSNRLDHAWNIVYINGEPYHADVSWDDIAWEIGERGAVGIVAHDYFLKSSEKMYEIGYEADDYDTTPDDTTYDSFFWQNSLSEFCLVNDEIYYIDNYNARLMRYSDTEVLCSVSDLWVDSQWNWGNHARLASDGKNLFYSQADSIYRYDLSNDTAEMIYEADLSGYNSIYGFTYADGYLVCDINDTPPYSGYGTDNLYQIKVLYEEEKSIIGDVDGNEVINMLDVISLRRYLLNATQYPVADETSADANGNGTVNMLDVIALRRYLLNATQYPLG